MLNKYNSAGTKCHSILAHGAAPHLADNAPAFAAAISACMAGGGGKVIVPPGLYRSGSIQLLAGVELQLEKGAVIEGVGESGAYHVMAKRPLMGAPEDVRNRYPKQAYVFVWAKGASDISITGAGEIIGPNGGQLTNPQFRPSLVSLIDCQNVRIAGIAIRNSCFWSLHLLRCRDVVVEDCIVETPFDRINGDGIDPDGCVNVRISRCRVATGDDALCIKSSEGDPVENVLVEDCEFQSGCCAAIKLGTESIGCVRGVKITRCKVLNSHWGIMLYMKDGGAYQDVEFSDCTIETWGRVSLLVDIAPRFYRHPSLGRIDGVNITRCHFRGPGKALFEGRPDRPICRLKLDDVCFELTGALPKDPLRKPNGAGLVEVDPAAVNYVAEPGRLIFAHVNGAVFNNLRIEPQAGEGARLIACQSVVTDGSLTERRTD